MTVDAAITRYEGYKNRLLEDIFRIAEHEYARCALQNGAVDKSELRATTYEMLYIEYRDQLIEEAIERGDHIMYGMNRTDFIVQFFESNGFDGESIPFIRQSDFRNAFELFLSQRKLMIFEYTEAENSPLQEVW